MFDSLKLRFFMSKVQAELIAQYNDQSFVNKVCQLPEHVEQLDMIRRAAYYRKEKVAPFLAVCFILGECIDSEFLTQEERHIAAALLAQRLQRVSSDPSFRLRHIMIFGDLDAKLSTWSRENELA